MPKQSTPVLKTTTEDLSNGALKLVTKNGKTYPVPRKGRVQLRFDYQPEGSSNAESNKGAV